MLCIVMNRKLYKLDGQRETELIRNTKIPLPAYHIIWAIGNVANKHRKTFRNLEQVSLHKGFMFYKISLSGTLLDICKMSRNNLNNICRSFLLSGQVVLVVCVKLVAPTNLSQLDICMCREQKRLWM